ncbi:MAG: HAMP domain-containing protein [Deltaproteobacteria bacterium]|nr:HAMP domain-containing protein [Deltaproteobacteria bacterium]
MGAPAKPRRIQRLSIPNRIFLGFALLVVSFGGVSAASVVQHDDTAQTLQLLHEGYLPLALTVGEAKVTQAAFGTVLDQVMSERDPTATRNYLQAGRQVRRTTIRRGLQRVSRAAELEPGPQDRAALRATRGSLESVAAAYREIDARYDQLFEALDDEDQERARQVLDQIRDQERTVQALLRDAQGTVQERIALLSAEAAERERRAAVLLGALTGLGLLLGLGVIFAVHRMLTPLPQIMDRVAAVARGDLSAKLEPRTDDELGRLATEFERMVEALGARDQRLREAAEAELRLQRMQEQIVTALSAAVLVIDAEGRVRTANPAAAVVLGVAMDAVGEPLAESGLFEHVPDLEEAIARVEGGAPRATLAAVPAGAADLDGDAVVNAVVTPFAGADGTVLVVAEDVTEELATKARLIHTERLAAIGRMAAHVTHEVRNPLSSIGLNVEMLEEELEGAGPETIALMRAITREIDRLTGITEEYLRLARLPQPHLEAEDLGTIIRSVATFVGREMEGSGVSLDVRVAEDLPQVALDEQQIRQALLNLLRNAREAMPDGGRVELEAAGSGTGVTLTVKDQGQGIPEAQRRRIFDLFYTTKERGTGLGLPLTRQIVVAHGGTIRCEGGPGEGTTFELVFPAARDVGTAHEPAAETLGAHRSE